MEQMKNRTEQGTDGQGTPKIPDGYSCSTLTSMLHARPIVAASDGDAGSTKDDIVMLTLVINGMTGLIAALVIASLIHSLRAFIPAWKQLSAQVQQLEKGTEVRVIYREVCADDFAPISAPIGQRSAHKEKATVSPVAPASKVRSAARLTLNPSLA